MDEPFGPLLLTHCSRCGDKVSPYRPSGLGLSDCYEYDAVPSDDDLAREPHYWCSACSEHWLAMNLQDTGCLCACGLVVPMHHRYCGGCGVINSGYWGHRSKLIKAYDQAIKLTPQYAETYNNRGVAYYMQKHYPQAIEDYNKAIKVNPQYAEAYHNRGIAYYMQKQYSQAKADLQKAAELYRSKNYTAHYQEVMDLLQKLPQ